MECSVNSLLLTRNDKASPVEKGKSCGSFRPVKVKSFKNQFGRMQSRSAAPKQQAAEKSIPRQVDKNLAQQAEKEAAGVGRETGQSVLSNNGMKKPDSMGHDLFRAIDAVLPQINIEAKMPSEAELSPELPAGLSILLTASNPGSGEQAESTLPGTAAVVFAHEPVQPWTEPTPAAGQTLTAAAEQPSGTTDAETDNGESPADKAGYPDRFRLMLHNNKNHVFLKLKVQQDSAATVKDQDLSVPPGQAKKLLDFESHRLAGAKLPDKSNLLFEQSSPQGGEKADTNLLITIKDSPGGSRVMIHSLPQAGSNTPVLPQTEEVFAQIVDKAKLMVKMSSSEMNIDLKPEFLGKLSIKVMVEDGLVTARFLTDNHHVKQMLETNLNALRQNLENQGLKVDKTEVEVQLGNERNFDSPGSWKGDGWAEQHALQSNPVLSVDETGLAVLDMDNLADNNLADIYEYSANGQMNILV